MSERQLKITINGTGFAGDYTARVYGMIPHKNGVSISLAGVTSGGLGNAQRFAAKHAIPQAFATHAEMLDAIHPDIDNIACANYAHGQYTVEAAEAGVGVIVLEKPPVIWPGYAAGREANAETRKRETMEYLAAVLDAVRAKGAKLLYAEDFVYFDGVRGLTQLLAEAMKTGKGKVLYQRGVCAHQGSHAPAYDTPSKSGGGSLFNKACHPLGPILYLKQVEGILRDGKPIRPARVSAVALQILKHQSAASGEHFRVMQNVDDFGRITVVFDDHTVAEVLGYDLSISGIRNELSIMTDFAQYDIRVNPSNENELFLPNASAAGNIVFREKLPTPQGTSFPRPNQFHSHGYVNEMNDAVDCALEADRYPQSGAMMAWDTMAVLMAGYESSEKDAAFVDVTEYTRGRGFTERELPCPAKFGDVFQRT
ncbi:MAG: Gfo/Idh/MocA family oxidoreductase [Candidatus Hydrogenedentes bacterium]|nr:Gfo/Idh/MocA family oxidoreductase [Candidatus Hydrogenedentota bacterium]